MKKDQLLPRTRSHLQLFADTMISSPSSDDQAIARMLHDESIKHHHYGEQSVDTFRDSKTKTVTIVAGKDDSKKSWTSMSESDFETFIQGAASQMGMSA